MVSDARRREVFSGGAAPGIPRGERPSRRCRRLLLASAASLRHTQQPQRVLAHRGARRAAEKAAGVAARAPAGDPLISSHSPPHGSRQTNPYTIQARCWELVTPWKPLVSRYRINTAVQTAPTRQTIYTNPARTVSECIFVSDGYEAGYSCLLRLNNLVSRAFELIPSTGSAETRLGCAF
jgi:hypothetical protein